MSTAADEATIAEANEQAIGDLTDPDPDEEPEPEPDDELEPEAAAPRTEAEMERAFKALEKEGDRHRSAVSRIMGDDALELIPCELCTPNLAGFRFPVEPDDDVREAVLEAIGLGSTGEFEKGDDARGCETCHGRGQVLTGSLVPEHRLKLCRTCTGAGWVHVPQPGSPPAPAPVYDSTPPQPPVTEAVAGADPWGRAPGDPLFGVMPGYEGGR